MTGEEPDQGGRSDVLHQKHVRFQTLEYVDPTELGASGTTHSMIPRERITSAVAPAEVYENI